MAFKKGPITTQPKAHPCVFCGAQALRKLRDPLERVKGHPWICKACDSDRRMDQ